MAIDQLFLLKFIKFCAVGFSGMFVDFGTTWFLKEKVRINKYVANSTGFTLAATSNYILNRLWTFHSENKQVATEYFMFMLIAAVGLVINNLVIYLLHGRMKMNFYVAKVFAVGVVTVWNFMMNYMVTFR